MYYITTIVVVVVLSHHSDASQTYQKWELLSFSTLLLCHVHIVIDSTAID